MQQIGSFEAKTHFSEILRHVMTGEEFLVTLRGKPVAVLTPFIPESAGSSLELLLSELDSFRTNITKRGGVLHKGETYKDLAREGLKNQW